MSKAASVPGEAPETVEYLADLFRRTFDKDPFGTLCTLLRVTGSSDAGWDPFDESLSAIADYRWALGRLRKTRGATSGRRFALLMYCQAVEMSAPHELLANVLRILSGSGYHVRPFLHLVRKRTIIDWVPPSAKRKFGEIRKLAEVAGEQRLIELIEKFFDDQIRNAFSHSDYVLTEDNFRWTETGVGRQITVEELDRTIESCFQFYDALLPMQQKALLDLSSIPRYHKWPNYQVLEILSEPSRGVCGFQMHFSNGSCSRFARGSGGVDSINMFFDKDGDVQFLAGDLDELEPVWKVDGNPVDNWDALNKITQAEGRTSRWGRLVRWVRMRRVVRKA